ncbi:MAG: hypothetical protein IIB16_11665 [Chloroflexi bacterium]|nr:hypothetical protein [Chloroflexota bacterium]
MNFRAVNDANTAANNGVSTPSGARQPRITPPRIVLVTDSVRHMKVAVSLRGKWTTERKGFSSFAIVQVLAGV